MGADAVTDSSLPFLYASWIEEVLGGPVPKERHATCSACAMCRPTAVKAATGSLALFDPATKCCTYVPTLPNFLVGRILCDDDPTLAAGRASIERRITQGTGVTPLGLQPDPTYALIHKYAGRDLFGRTQGLQCPHYLPGAGGRCGIWRYRNAVCATYFCKFERGAVGMQFWETLLQLLATIERHLALWCAGELGEPVEQLGVTLVPYYVTKLHGPQNTWSEQSAGHAEGFYRRAARLTELLSWNQVREIGGPDVTILAERLRKTNDAARFKDMPEYLRLGTVAVIARDNETIAVMSYNRNDTLLLPAKLVDALQYFDGRHRNDEVCRTIREQIGISVDDTTLRRLVDFAVLQVMPVL